MLLRIEPFSGVSGDMMLGALVDLGDAGERLVELPERLGLAGASLRIGTAARCGIRCAQVTVTDATAPRARHLSDIHALIDGARLPDGAQSLARRIFGILGAAEAAVHGIPLERVHFHEVGAVDSILDIVGAAWLLDALDVDGVVCDPIRTGTGFVDCDHGRLPVPAPATARILEGLPTWPGDTPGEMTTPTGAAIVAALAPSFTVPVATTVATGYGAGQREFAHPNCLRLSLVEPLVGAGPGDSSGEAWVLQADLDDATGELLGGHLQARLREVGALDVTLAPLLMKKGRPGHRLEAICREEARVALTSAILEETTTIGVRAHRVQRRELPRRQETVRTPYGEVGVKAVTLPSGRVRRTPEYEDCRARAVETGATVQEVMRAALSRCDTGD